MIVTPLQTRLQYFHASESLVRDSALVSTDTLECQGGQFVKVPETTKTTKNHRRHHRETVVQFFPMVEMHETLHVNDYTADEIANVWYSEQDMASMRADEKVALDRFECGIYTDDDDNEEPQQHQQQPHQYCIRGLEARTKWGSRQRRYNKDLGRAAVFQEQSLQDYESKYDPDAIARAYAAATKHCSAAALEVGLMDEMAASGRRLTSSSKPTKNGMATSETRRVGPLGRIFRLRNKQ